MKKLAALALTCTLALGVSAGIVSADESLTVGLALSGITSNTIFIDMTKSLQAKCDEAGYKLMTADIQEGVQATVTALENFKNAGCDVIILQDSEEAAYYDLLKECIDSGIVVGSYDYNSELAQYSIYSSDEQIGYAIGAAAAEYCNNNEGSKKACICNYSQLNFLVVREQAIEKGFLENCPDGEIVSVQDAGYPPEGVTAGENFLQACPDVQVVMGINDGGCLGVYEAFKAAGKSREADGIAIFASDASEDGLNALEEDNMYYCTLDLDLVNQVNTLYDRCVETALTGEVDESVHSAVYPINPIYLSNITDVRPAE